MSNLLKILLAGLVIYLIYKYFIKKKVNLDEEQISILKVESSALGGVLIKD